MRGRRKEKGSTVARAGVAGGVERGNESEPDEERKKVASRCDEDERGKCTRGTRAVGEGVEKRGGRERERERGGQNDDRGEKGQPKRRKRGTSVEGNAEEDRV